MVGVGIERECLARLGHGNRVDGVESTVFEGVVDLGPVADPDIKLQPGARLDRMQDVNRKAVDLSVPVKTVGLVA